MIDMPNRLLCTVLEEMRQCYKTRNFSYLMGLIEEAQMMGDRMEGALYDQKDYAALSKRVSEKRKELRELETRIAELKDAGGIVWTSVSAAENDESQI